VLGGTAPRELGPSVSVRTKCRRLRFNELRFATMVTLCDDSRTSRHPPVSRGLPCERRGALIYLPRRSFALAYTLRCYWLLLPRSRDVAPPRTPPVLLTNRRRLCSSGHFRDGLGARRHQAKGLGLVLALLTLETQLDRIAQRLVQPGNAASTRRSLSRSRNVCKSGYTSRRPAACPGASRRLSSFLARRSGMCAKYKYSYTRSSARMARCTRLGSVSATRRAVEDWILVRHFLARRPNVAPSPRPRPSSAD
jgi:hypothetical protein